ncbi:hypothetical protein, partial [Ralstonia sp.]|uniref:hypothetical protein n=1 Tax=Ralstonia sp. TaxID=54061 RepID=UPI002BB87940
KCAPEMAKDSFNFRNRAEAGKTRCAQTVPRLFSARLQKLKAPSRAGKSKDNSHTFWEQAQTTKANLAMGWPFSFDVRPLMAP